MAILPNANRYELEAILTDLAFRDPIRHGPSWRNRESSCRFCFASNALNGTVAGRTVRHTRECIWRRACQFFDPKPAAYQEDE